MQKYRPTTTTMLLLSSSPGEFSDNNNNTQDQEKEKEKEKEDEMMEHEQSEQQCWQVQQELEQILPVDSLQKRIDPPIASLTHINEPTPVNTPMVQVPLFGEIPMDGNLVLLFSCG